MAGSLGGESDHWQIVLVMVEHDGSVVLVAEPTRQAVPVPTVWRTEWASTQQLRSAPTRSALARPCCTPSHA